MGTTPSLAHPTGGPSPDLSMLGQDGGMAAFSEGPEVELPRGDVTEGVVRIGDTVRRPHQSTSAVVEAYLLHLESAGFTGAPRWLGRDHQGRDVLTFLEGDVAGSPVDAWATSDEVLPGVARLLRRLHDASESFDPPTLPVEPGKPTPSFPAGEPVIFGHRDLTPQNTVFRDGVAWGVIDFDLSNRTTRSVDFVNTAMHWVPLCADVDVEPGQAGRDAGSRLRLMYDAYGRDRFDVDLLLEAARLRFSGSYAAMKWAAENLGGGWARMWDEGVGDVIRRRVAWLDESRDDLRHALV
ncbi:phosphotransferase [Microbacterium hibisci]|uniref:phosphotransferase n=1 Tax=Microbacterium hibisci TaxID=2036000 RepID=UPI0019404CE9|nr:phosphotransferase [Microbacterium hibisci]